MPPTRGFTSYGQLRATLKIQDQGHPGGAEMGPPAPHHLSHHPGHRGSGRQSPAAAGSDFQTLLKFVGVTVPSAGRVDSCTAPASIPSHTPPGEGSGTRPWCGGRAQLLPTQGPRWGSVTVLLIHLQGRLKLPPTPRRRPDGIKNQEPPPTGTLCHEAHLGHQRPQAAAGNGWAERYRGKAPSSSITRRWGIVERTPL